VVEAIRRWPQVRRLMEGKEVRFGADTSALWATPDHPDLNGSVNAMHDSLAPLTGG
jgi:K+-transporting ATPase ATPase A chain